MNKSPIALVLGLIFCAQTAAAGEREDLEQLRNTTIELINTLVEQGVLKREQAAAMIKQAQQRAASTSPPPTAGAGTPPGVVRVPYVPESVKAEIREEVKQEVIAQAQEEGWAKPGELPAWIKRIEWNGDFRLRFQADRFGDDNLANSTPSFLAINRAGGITRAGDSAFINTADNRERYRIRLRLAAKGKVNDRLTLGARLASGSTQDPVSTNQTLGNTGSPYQITIERAYLKFTPSEDLALWGGRIPNPWFGTDLLWDHDLNFEGFAAQYHWTNGSALTPFANAGVFPLQEVELSTADKWLFGAQTGVVWKLPESSKFTLGVGYYDYQNIDARRNPLNSRENDYFAPQFLQKGNTLFDIRNDADPTTNLFALASDFNELNLTGQWDYAGFDPTHVIITTDYVNNLGFDRQDILARTGADIEERNEGYQARLVVGRPELKKLFDWQLQVGYRHLERDAVLDAFTESDFHLGGTDTEGYILGGSLGLAADTWFTATWYSADEIDGPPLAIDVLQLDLNARF